MRATTSLRRAAAEASTSAQRLSKTSEKRTPFLPGGQAPASTLQSLVGLHHSSANFMRDPAEITTAFESAFRHHQPQFQTYDSFRATSIRLRDEHAVGGLAAYASKNPGGAGAHRAIKYNGIDDLPDQAQITKDIFRPPRKYTSKRSRAGELSERELMVKEALFGTWERGNDGVPRPALDGVVDVVKARGLSLKQAAREWKNRDGK